jgi:hypothetical protein
MEVGLSLDILRIFLPQRAMGRLRDGHGIVLVPSTEDPVFRCISLPWQCSPGC